MLEQLGIWLIVALACFGAGVPSAAVLRDARDGRIAIVADSLTHGVVVLTMGMTLWLWLGIFGLILAATLWLGPLAALLWWRSDTLPIRQRLHWPLIAAWVAILIIAIALRLHNVNFIPWIGDMGAYVNWANEFANTGEFRASWPPLFPAFLAASSALFGMANTGVAVGWCGILFIIAAARALQRMQVNTWVVLGAAVLLTLHQHAVWFSTFPVSEALTAPIFVVWLSLIHQTFTASRRFVPALLIAQVVYGAALGLLRGSGPLLLIPLVVLALSLIVVKAWRSYRGRIMLLLGANLAGVGIGYWYGVAEIRAYTVDMQMGKLLPGPLKNLAEVLGLLDPSIALAAAIVIPTALLLYLGFRTTSKEPTDFERPSLRPLSFGLAPRVLLIALAVVLTVGLALDALVSAMVWQIALRMSLVLLVGAILAILLCARPAGRVVDQLNTAFLGLMITMFIGLHTIRLGPARGHDFYLYWDRYLLSEIMPAAILLTAVVAGVMLVELRSRSTAIIALTAALGVAVVPQLPSLALQSQHTYLDGAYSAIHELAELDEGETPRAWVASSAERHDGFIFPNTWMAMAVPLKRSFGLEVINADQSRDNFGPDEVLTADSLVAYLACTDGGELLVHEAQTGGTPLEERVVDSRLTFSALPAVRAEIQTLTDPPVDGTWQTATLDVESWRIALDPSVSLSCQRD